jgi:hypothetical protein
MCMPDERSALMIPLRSNANALLTGSPIGMMRRRIKFASLFFDRIYLEWGVFRMHAGPDGHFSAFEEPDAENPPQWQTPSQRGADQRASFTVGIGREDTPGVPASTVQAAIESPTTVSWVATLYPFTREFPADTDWIQFARTTNPTGAADRLARRWTSDDESNAALRETIPETFVRGAVIKNANRDLVVGAADGIAVSLDALHSQVAAQRFRDGSWQSRGFTVPILFPNVGHLPWEAIADLRRDKNMTRFRAVLREVEEEAAEEAAAGDLEEAAQHAYERHLAGYPETLPSIGMIAHRTLTGFVIGSVAGNAVSGIIGPLGIPAGAALGAAATTVTDVIDVIQRRRSRGWIALHHQIDALRRQ